MTNNKSVFADRRAKHLDATIKQAFELLELAQVLANKTALIDDITNIRQQIHMLKIQYREEFPE